MPYMRNDPNEMVTIATESKMDPFEQLVQDLSDVLGPSSGLDSDDVDPMDVQRLMEGYTSKIEEWKQYALGDRSRPYTRNLVDEGNGKSNLLILVWSPGKGSAIHDHANAHCVMKILKGTLKETIYEWPEGGEAQNGEGSPMQIKRDRVYGENQVTYMSDKLGLHRISNPDPNDFAISLHLYTPPNAAHYGFRLFDESTGKSKHIKQSNFFSKNGEKL